MPNSKGIFQSNPGIIVVPATGRGTAIILIGAQIASDAKSQATLRLITPGQSFLSPYFRI